MRAEETEVSCGAAFGGWGAGCSDAGGVRARGAGNKQISDAGGVEIAKGLATNTTLKKINLDSGRPPALFSAAPPPPHARPPPPATAHAPGRPPARTACECARDGRRRR